MQTRAISKRWWPMSLAKRQKLLSFCTGLAVAGAAYVSTQVRTKMAIGQAYQK